MKNPNKLFGQPNKSTIFQFKKKKKEKKPTPYLSWKSSFYGEAQHWDEKNENRSSLWAALLCFMTLFLKSLLCLATPSRPTLCDLTDWSSPGSSVHRILQARILEWVAIPFSRGSSLPRDRTCLLNFRQILYHLSHQGSPLSHCTISLIHSGTGDPPNSPLGQSNSPLKPRHNAAADSFETGPVFWNTPKLTHHNLPVVRLGKISDAQQVFWWKKKVNPTGFGTGWYNPIWTHWVAYGSFSKRNSSHRIAVNCIGEGWGGSQKSGL